MNSTVRLVRVAVFVALCAVGAFIPIPSPTGTVGLDSLPGYMAAALMGGWAGALVGALGHIFSAWAVGFPISIPIHLFIALQMAFYVSAFGYLHRKGQKVLAIVVGILLNGVLAPASLIPFFGIGFFFAMLPFLIVASAINIILAAMLLKVSAIKKIGEKVINLNENVS